MQQIVSTDITHGSPATADEEMVEDIIRLYDVIVWKLTGVTLE